MSRSSHPANPQSLENPIILFKSSLRKIQSKKRKKIQKYTQSKNLKIRQVLIIVKLTRKILNLKESVKQKLRLKIAKRKLVNRP
jgi:hypothetical protein